MCWSPGGRNSRKTERSTSLLVVDKLSRLKGAGGEVVGVDVRVAGRGVSNGYFSPLNVSLAFIHFFFSFF